MTPSEVASVVQRLQRQVSQMADSRDEGELATRTAELRAGLEDLEARLAVDATRRAGRAPR